MKTLIISLTLLFIVSTINAQDTICGTQYHMQQIANNDPTYQQRTASMEIQIQNYINNNTINTSLILEIPCVVHVVYYEHDSSQNISDAQIQEQIDILNRDFRKLNTDKDSIPNIFQSRVADMQMEFCLKGITRTETVYSAFSYYGNYVKSDYTGGKSPWDTKHYLNIWICNLYGGLLGYSQFPNLGPDSTDGVVVDYGTIGEDTTSWNLLYEDYAGRVLQHEVGHWINLRHIWGDANNCNVTDHVDDTPNQRYLYRDCYTDTTSCTTQDLVMNYMDYVPCWCMRCFTNGQKLRAWGSIALYRTDIFNNTCNIPVANINKIKTSNINIYPTQFSDIISIDNLFENSNVLIYDSFGEKLYEEHINRVNVQINLSQLSSGIYYVIIHHNNTFTIKKILKN